MRKNVFPMTAGVLGSLALAVSASGGFINVTIVPYFPSQPPPNTWTWRVVANYTSSFDIVVSWGAVQGTSPLVFFTGGAPLINDPASPFAGLKQEDFAQFPLGSDWDSWVTVGTTVFAGNATDYDQGFIGSNGVDAFIVGSAFSETNGLVFNSDPNSPIFGPAVVLAQFTLPTGVGFFLKGVVGSIPFGAAGPVQFDTFVVDNIPAPGALALFGLAGLVGSRRRP